MNVKPCKIYEIVSQRMNDSEIYGIIEMLYQNGYKTKAMLLQQNLHKIHSHDQIAKIDNKNRSKLTEREKRYRILVILTLSMQTIATGTKNQSRRSTPHILGMMELGKITQEIKRIQEGIPYKIIRIFQHSESTSQILDGKSIKRNPAATFDF
jgi:hypothetical protein